MDAIRPVDRADRQRAAREALGAAELRDRHPAAPRGHKPIKSSNLQAWAAALSGFISAGVVHPTPDDEEYIRDTMELPAIPVEQLKELEAERQQQAAAAKQAQLAALQAKSGAPADEPRQAHDHEGCTHTFAEPSPFRGEQPAYKALGTIIEQFKGDLVDHSRALRDRVLRIVGLDTQKFNDAAFTLTDSQAAAVDTAIEQFIAELVGDGAGGGVFDDEALLPSFLRLAHATGVNQAAKQLNADVSSLLTKDSGVMQRLAADAFQRLSSNGQLRIGDQLGDIKTILQQGQSAGDSPLSVAKELNDRFAGYEKFEWERLARTEMASAANTGTLDEYKEAGVDRYEWSISGLACAICSSFAGQVFTVGDGPVPPEDSHPNCLCAVSPVTEDKK
jgi:SPP1 gp7 family putative phage head morphogenesis protein